MRTKIEEVLLFQSFIVRELATIKSDHLPLIVIAFLLVSFIVFDFDFVELAGTA